ncbi:MAG: hypothetical protein M3410_07390 [Acidobacteriota bacterium]|nr:hypothetical protein [Acidobacteriota bacterium]
MEHQTIIAYGNNFKFDADGFDWLMFHELGHERWGNLVTASDWREFWISVSWCFVFVRGSFAWPSDKNDPRSHTNGHEQELKNAK